MGDCCLAPSSPACETSRGDISPLESKHVVELSCTWTLNKLCKDDRYGPITSPVFSSASSNKLKWNLRLYPCGSSYEVVPVSRAMYDSEKHYMSLFLYLQPCNKSEIRAKFKFSVIGSDGRKINVMGNNEPSVFKHGKLGYGFTKYMKSGSVTLNEPYGVLVNDKLTILCEIVLIDVFDNEEPKSRLVDDVKLFESQRYTDFKIIANDKEFCVHRAILASRSSVFLAMFKHDMKEREQNCVEIEDMNSEVLEAMLRFIYTDKVKNIEKIAKELLVAADKYALERLKSMCEESLYTSLKIENAADMLILADIHSLDWLKERTLEFITERNNTTYVMATEGFKSMITSHPLLIAEILHVTCARRN